MFISRDFYLYTRIEEVQSTQYEITHTIVSESHKLRKITMGLLKRPVNLS